MTVVTKRLPNGTYELDVSGIGNVVLGSNYTIVLMADVSNTTIIGNGNTINAASGINFGVTGTYNTINASSDAIWLNTGVGNTTIFGSDNTINAASGINFGVTGTGYTINASLDAIWLNSSVGNTTILGNGNTINAASGINFGVTGTGHTINALSDAIWLNSGVGNTTIIGGGNMINAAAGINFGVTGANYTINASSDAIWINPGARNATIFGSGNTVNSVPSTINGGRDVANEIRIFGDRNVVNAASSDQIYLLSGGDNSVYGNTFQLNVGSGVSATIKGGGNDVVLGLHSTLRFLPGSTTGIIHFDVGGFDTLLGPTSVFQYTDVHGFKNSDIFTISDLTFSSKMELKSSYTPNPYGSPWEQLILSNPDAKSAENPGGVLAYFRIFDHVRDEFEVYAEPTGGVRIDVGFVSGAIHVR